MDEKQIRDKINDIEKKILVEKSNKIIDYGKDFDKKSRKQQGKIIEHNKKIDLNIDELKNEKRTLNDELNYLVRSDPDFGKRSKNYDALSVIIGGINLNK